MSYFELLLTAAALSMDAMAVSISSGISAQKLKAANAAVMAFFFGLFQAFMPVAGYFIIPALTKVFGDGVTAFIEASDHWIAFALLAFIGGKMIVEAIKNEPETGDANPFGIGNIILMAVATSIDALATGIVFSGLELTPGELCFAIGAIGVITFILSFAGVILGRKLGETFKRWAVLGGGAALVLIGAKIAIEHLLA